LLVVNLKVLLRIFFRDKGFEEAFISAGEKSKKTIGRVGKASTIQKEDVIKEF
jgi:hypothetical protein